MEAQMIYNFYCDKCRKQKDVEAPIQEGPPEVVKCECGKRMCREYSTNFILKGSWPGKDIKREKTREGDDATIEKFEKKIDENKSKKDLNDEVLAERRKGSAHMANWRERNKHKWNKYTAMRGGKKK